MVVGEGDIEGRQPINSGGCPNKAGSVCLRSVSSLLSLLWVQRDGRRHVARWNVGAETSSVIPLPHPTVTVTAAASASCDAG